MCLICYLPHFVAYADAATKPIDFTIAPSMALPIALKRAGLELKDISLFEFNEAFSVVARVNEQVRNLDHTEEICRHVN